LLGEVVEAEAAHQIQLTPEVPPAVEGVVALQLNISQHHLYRAPFLLLSEVVVRQHLLVALLRLDHFALLLVVLVRVLLPLALLARLALLVVLGLVAV
jgi:hypothetical protein